MTIRHATIADAEAIAAMLFRLAEETGDGPHFSTTAETIRAHGFGDAPLFETLIAEQNGAPAGLALFFRHFSTTRGQPGVYVQDLWIAPEGRSSGLGAALLIAAAAYARNSWGAAYLALTRHGHNEGADAFYTRFGFTAQESDVPMFLSGDGFTRLANRSKSEAAA
ncbi:GNAT family N-acetyltransferase [Aliiruegeria sabulilitoris]|uniref:GNAT family N-acetyltransferase n=1 Tax=Aliiruegeria sabulilitoris TaxID=1510458 RepID=UPI00083290B6|nr:GNAT family N-acetyltransferase [Aliiruegeria sabulilitoris]NDR56724.1 GNAT family N-acetyltransferase [Pseudoruegeria sp. M32A2M]